MKHWQIIGCILLHFTSTAQSGDWLYSIQSKLSTQEILSDSLKYKLIDIISDKSNNDSLRVDAVHLLATLKCDECISFLIEHVNDRFNYGEGASAIDQANETACWSALLSIGKDYNLFQKVSASLYMSERGDLSLRFLLDVLKMVRSREELKNMFIEERKKNSTNHFRGEPSKVYERNIDKLLIILNE